MPAGVPTDSVEATKPAPRGRPRTVGAGEGAQTLMRGLDVLEAIADGTTDLAALAARLGTTRTTTHRLAAALVARRYLNFASGDGYSLGPKLLELGFQTRHSMPLHQAARAHLARLAERTLDTVQLGILDEGVVFYIDKVPGQRRFEIRSNMGDRHHVWATGLGKALVLDMTEDQWNGFFGKGRPDDARPSEAARQEWLAQMRTYARNGVAFDLGETEAELRCVAAPIRDASGAIVAAVSVSSITQYMQPERMTDLSHDVRETAAAISAALGWRKGVGTASA
ncbi:IclR family transcriptional regulator [Xanthobacter autotrophicus]|uniref:IclR family transcriptional regulator n=2 Tax=Xanthobacter autotrophicus TaxID=280 RepID=A0A6C1KNF5_XANAU|nr:IclR family transcriptional regulator [Xanthobacter autotrophicus]